MLFAPFWDHMTRIIAEAMGLIHMASVGGPKWSEAEDEINGFILDLNEEKKTTIDWKKIKRWANLKII